MVRLKLAKLIQSLLTGTPKLPKTLNKFIFKMDFIPEIKEKIKSTVKQIIWQSENSN